MHEAELTFCTMVHLLEEKEKNDRAEIGQPKYPELIITKPLYVMLLLCVCYSAK